MQTMRRPGGLWGPTTGKALGLVALAAAIRLADDVIGFSSASETAANAFWLGAALMLAPFAGGQSAPLLGTLSALGNQLWDALDDLVPEAAALSAAVAAPEAVLPLANVAAFRAVLFEGNAQRAAGRLQAAIASYRRAVELAPQCGAGHYNLGIALRETGDWRGAAVAFRDAAQADPRDFDAVQNVVATLARAVNLDAPPLFAASSAAVAEGREPVSVVVCSIDEARLEAMRRSFRAALGARPHELIVIRDARSLCEGYERGLRAAQHSIVVFSHDDVELLSPRPFDALARALRDHDIVGVVGSTAVNGPAVGWAGHPHLHGAVAYPAAGNGACDATVFSLQGGVIGGMQALDGLLLAARREAALAIGFDARTFDGFHFYDLDFTYRAHLARLKVAVTTEVSALHASDGSFDGEWRRYAERFREKFALREAPQGPHHSYGARMESRARAARFYDELRALCALPR
jgi:tetratricopeptide (TPR) repeat protein